ncbi:Hypothetical_protein [Hexamita inflata]|uniref:Hypothetical_protein n=1 Tax=Hexamita inflata TaxID=28002 RepID=A0ABP1HCE0_9EUKA
MSALPNIKKSTPRAENIQIITRPAVAPQPKQSTINTSVSASRSGSSGVKFRYDPKQNDRKNNIAQMTFKQRLLQYEMTQNNSKLIHTRPETEAERTRAKKYEAIQSEKQELENSTKRECHKPKLQDPEQVRSIYEDKKMVEADQLARRMIQKASLNASISNQEKDLLKRAREDMKNGIQIDTMHGYDYNILRNSGLLDPNAPQLLQKTGYAAVSQIYTQAEQMASGWKKVRGTGNSRTSSRLTE